MGGARYRIALPLAIYPTILVKYWKPWGTLQHACRHVSRIRKVAESVYLSTGGYSMLFKKAVSICTIATQLSFVLSISAASADTGVPSSPESNLVSPVLTLKGLGLSDKDLQAQLSGALKNYNTTAPKDGRAERLQTALVDLNILTVQQARDFAQGADQIEKSLDQTTVANTDQAQKALQSQLALFMKINPVGAQFSACTAGIITTVAGVAAVVTGLVLAFDNPTCHPDYNNGYTCYQQQCQTCYDYYGNPYQCNCYDYQDTCYPTTCDNPSDYPYRTAGKI